MVLGDNLSPDETSGSGCVEEKYRLEERLRENTLAFKYKDKRKHPGKGDYIFHVNGKLVTYSQMSEV